MTDKKYKKDKEIALKPEKRQVRKYDEDLDEIHTQTVVPPLMKKSKLKFFIEDPHQKMIYEFHGKEFFSFHIELLKIIKAESSWSYPRCIKKTGELPKKVESSPPVITEILTPPKVVQPKIHAPKLTELPKLEKITEDEVELADIESQLDEILEEEAPVLAVQEISPAEEEIYGAEDEEMAHLEDFDDLDNIEQKYSALDRDSDDY